MSIWKFAILISENEELSWRYGARIAAIRIIGVLSFPFVGPVWLLLYIVSAFIAYKVSQIGILEGPPLWAIFFAIPTVLGMTASTFLIIFAAQICFKPSFFGVLEKMNIPKNEQWEYYWMTMDEFAVEFRKWNQQLH